jgi:large subunit ribosomal protein L22
VKIRGDKLSSLAKERGLSAEQLAAAVEREGLKGTAAVSAVKNWMRGNDHPRCRPTDCAKLASALGVELSAFVKFTSQVRNHRGSPRKAGLLVDLIRGKKAQVAENLLTFTTKRAALNVKKCLMAALADARNFGADVDRLYVVESRCDEATRMKRFHQKDRGRAHSITKKFSHITLSVAERTGKDGKK